MCVVTAGRDAPAATLDRIGAAARAGADLIQIREPQLSSRDLFDLTRRAVDGVRGTIARVLVNERADIAIAAGAAGVHLRGDSVAASRVRAIVAEGFVIGRSVHSVREARDADEDGGCDFVLFGTVFQSAGKPRGHRVAGIDELRLVSAAVRLPVLAIGGVIVDRVAEVAAAGAAGIAAIGLFDDVASIAATIARVRSRFDT